MATSSRPTMSTDERMWAFVVGISMAVMIITAGIWAIKGSDDSQKTLTILIAGGAFFAVLGTIGWILEFRPWRKFDDLTTPAYTGHAHDAHSAPGEHSEPEVHEPPPPPPVIVDPTSVFSSEPPAHH